MKIVIDATALLLRSAGVKSVLYHWLHALQALAGADSVVAYPPMPEVGGLDHEGSVAGRWPTLRGIVMAVANQRARELGVEASQCIISIAQASYGGESHWRVNYGAKEFVGRRGGDLVIDVNPGDCTIAKVLRGQ